MQSKRVLMCGPPEQYFPAGISYEINAHMVNGTPVDILKACKQWHNLKDALEKAGVWVSRLSQAPGLPDMVFTANAGLFNQKKNTVLLSRFRYPERKGEVRVFRNWFLSQGFHFKTLPSGIFFEGEGDALVFNDKLISGYGFRSDETGGRLAAEFMELEPAILRLVDPYFYHLDTCLCPIPEKNLIMYYPPAFDTASVLRIEKMAETVYVSDKDARRFVCNSVVLGSQLITTPTSPALKALLQIRGIEMDEIALPEFIKAGGAAKCLTLFI